MRFTPYALPDWFDVSPPVVQAKYRIGSNFVMVCNHFWKHKDHATAFRAFAHLVRVDHFRDCQLVCTGDPVDFRDPHHFPKLMSLASDLGIADRLHVLGLITKSDQLALLRGCRALWQPTRYEGGPGGGACYEAIGIGTPTVLSDIQINREIAEGYVAHFSAGSPDDLVAKTVELLMDAPETPSPDEALAAGRERLKALCDQILSFLYTRAGAAP
jgi:glycosyltransferase involved in cell wall biosynthesis